ncbi:MAG: DNA repair protein RadC [Elusimicrobiota bacterium]
MNKNIGHRKRIKEKYLKKGIAGWHDYEVLELLLTYAIPQKDTKPIAKRLLSKFKTFDSVLTADIKELQKVTGIAEHSAILLKLFKDIAEKFLEKRIIDVDILSSPNNVYDYLKIIMKGKKNEEFFVLFLDSKNHVIASEQLQTGTVNESVIYPRNIVERALLNHAVSVIIAHNHPSGLTEPSADDMKATEAVKQALKTVDISLIDHIIVGAGSYYSFMENKKM